LLQRTSLVSSFVKISWKGEWITRGDGNLVWLLHEYRPVVTAVREDIIAMGYQSGCTAILQVNYLVVRVGKIVMPKRRKLQNKRG
jgi:hypothetical protein